MFIYNSLWRCSLNNYVKIFFLSVAILFSGYGSTGWSQTNKNKSINQGEWQKNQGDTIKGDTVLQVNKTGADRAVKQTIPIRTAIHLSLLIVIFGILIISLTILLIVRHAYRLRKE